MNIRAKSEKGFSLIELLVVVAIIGVLAAVGVVGYQGYIDSTKKSVTESNAKAVHQWILNTKTVRAAGIDVKPSECGKTTSFSSATCFGSASSGIASSADGAPFNGFKNPYDAANQTGASAIVARSTAYTVGDACGNDSNSAAITKGDIIVAYSTAALPTTLSVWYCDDATTARQKETTTIEWK